VKEKIMAEEVSSRPEIKRKGVRSGRRPGAISRGSAAAIARLKKAGFDPIEKMVEFYNEVDKELADLRALKEKTLIKNDGNTVKYSHHALIGLLELKGKVTSELLRYAYARVPETNVIENVEKPRVTFNITPRMQANVKKPIEGTAVTVDSE